MKSNVTFVDLTVYKNIAPLLFGYLQVYACKDPSIKDFYSFETYSTTVKSLPTKVLQELQKKDSFVFAFSCYMWNMGLVSYLIKTLQKDKPDSYFILGGPQAINSGDKHLNPINENVLVCNGEGERTFSNFLKELMKPKPNFSKVRGLTFFREQELITTGKEDQIKDLDEIPSPFQNNIFPKGLYSYTVFKTNRSCPFECSFCFWGAEVGKLSKFSDQRIKEDLKWISKNMIYGVFIADANWGILKRDIEFSQTMANNKKSYGNPIFVVINSAKNQPDRLVDIAKIFQGSGMLSSHSISLQTLSPKALTIANRKNIPIDGYVKLQKKMFEKN